MKPSEWIIVAMIAFSVTVNAIDANWPAVLAGFMWGASFIGWALKPTQRIVHLTAFMPPDVDEREFANRLADALLDDA